MDQTPEIQTPTEQETLSITEWKLVPRDTEAYREYIIKYDGARETGYSSLHPKSLGALKILAARKNSLTFYESPASETGPITSIALVGSPEPLASIAMKNKQGFMVVDFQFPGTNKLVRTTIPEEVSALFPGRERGDNNFVGYSNAEYLEDDGTKALGDREPIPVRIYTSDTLMGYLEDIRKQTDLTRSLQVKADNTMLVVIHPTVRNTIMEKITPQDIASGQRIVPLPILYTDQLSVIL